MEKRIQLTKWFFIWAIFIVLLATFGVALGDLVLQGLFVVVSLVFILCVLGSGLLWQKGNLSLSPLSREITLKAGESRKLDLTIKANLPLLLWKLSVQDVGENFIHFSASTENLWFSNVISLSLTGLRRGYVAKHLRVVVSDPLEIFRIYVSNFFLEIRCFPDSFEAPEVEEFTAKIEGDVFPRLGRETGDPLKLREYQPGDALKRVAWKLYAKTGKLITRCFEPADDELNILVLYALIFPDDEVLAYASLKVAAELRRREVSLLYATNISNEITADSGNFTREILNSDPRTPRKSLKDFFSNNAQLISHRLVLLLYSTREESLRLLEAERSCFALHQVMEVACAKTVEEKNLLNVLLEPRKPVFYPVILD